MTHKIDTDTKLTLRLLLLISDHLSTRGECREVNYRVIIKDNTISFEPDVKVFPSTHNRKPSDKANVLEHILRYHMPSVLPPKDELMRDVKGRYRIQECSDSKCNLLPGTYVYRSSIDGKRRKWFRE